MFKNPSDIKHLPYFNEEKNYYTPCYDKNCYHDFLTLKQMAFEKVVKAGFSIEQTSPSKANCIIRFFSNKLRLENQLDYTQIIYGFNYYTKTLGKWVTKTKNNKKLELNFSKCEFRVWYFHDEYEDYKCDFIDCYVKVS